MVEEHKRNFLQLIYQVRLYDPAIGDTFLVTRFILGLNEELRGAMEIQFPITVAAIVFAAV